MDCIFSFVGSLYSMTEPFYLVLIVVLRIARLFLVFFLHKSRGKEMLKQLSKPHFLWSSKIAGFFSAATQQGRKGRGAIFKLRKKTMPLRVVLEHTYYMKNPRDQLFRFQNKYFVLRILSRSRHNFVLIYFFVNKYLLLFA